MLFVAPYSEPIEGWFTKGEIQKHLRTRKDKPELFDKKVREFMISKGWDKLSKEELTEKVSEALGLLVDLGLVERLIGEDGKFYYRSIKK